MRSSSLTSEHDNRNASSTHQEGNNSQSISPPGYGITAAEPAEMMRPAEEKEAAVQPEAPGTFQYAFSTGEAPTDNPAAGRLQPPAYGLGFVDHSPAPIQRTADTGQQPFTDTAFQPALSPNNTGLPDNLKAGVETLSGYAMDDVKVHYNSSKPAQLDALAYAQGTDIHLGPGQERHLPHEAWHVVQQKEGRVRPTLQAKGVAINDNNILEKEADAMGAKASAFGLGQEFVGKERTEQRLGKKTPKVNGNIFQREVIRGGRAITDPDKVAQKVIELCNGALPDEDYQDLWNKIKNNSDTKGRIKNIITEKDYIGSDNKYDIIQVAKEVLKEIEKENIPNQLEDVEDTVTGIKIKIAKQEVFLKDGGIRPVPDTPAEFVDLHAMDIYFKVDVAILNSSESESWQVGFIQTVLSVNREFEADVFELGDKVGTIKSKHTLESAANDRHNDLPGPWYSTEAFSDIGSGAQMARPKLHDKPGTEISLEGFTAKITKRQGKDVFKTWLILLNPETGEKKFLRRWDWSVDYENEQGIVTILENPGGVELAGEEQADAVLSGTSAGEILESSKQVEQELIKSKGKRQESTASSS